ncbi:unnamed protein product [Adineta ricciae]|uniref:NACHT domain-containing protein n=1 Tax=Adineta ricciae TaxID=249248 RepID=A0A815NNS7_ADIRI|nr:unnamed protein product [Adineta ricciae]
MYRKLEKHSLISSLIQRDQIENINFDDCIQAFQTERWLIILGDPGSGKTSFVRWLACQYAKAVRNRKTYIEGLGLTRMPILIHIGEFAEYLEKHESAELFDYIGYQTWMKTEVFSSSQSGSTTNALQEYVIQGKALVILDGLDEIPKCNVRRKVIYLVKKFIDSYVLTPSGVSPFDDSFVVESCKLTPTKTPPSETTGNQLVMTSRIIGYYAEPLAGDYINPYMIMPMSTDQQNAFIDRWYANVDTAIIEILSLSSENLKRTPIKTTIRETAGQLKTEIKQNSSLAQLASNIFLVSIICSQSFRTYGRALPISRAHLYHDTIATMLNEWEMRSSIPSKMLERFLTVIATHIHDNSSSGLIDEYFLKRYCDREVSDSKDAQIHEETVSNFIKLLNDETGVLIARGEKVYGFSHLTFQEYFVCLNIIKSGCLGNRINDDDDEMHEIVHRFLSLGNQSRYREPLLLGLGYISWKWNSNGQYDRFCTELISNDEKSVSKHIPLGALLLILAIDDLECLPSKSIVFGAFAQLLTAAGKYNWQISYPQFEDQVVKDLRKLEPSLASECVQHYLTNRKTMHIESLRVIGSIFLHEVRSDRNGSWLNKGIVELYERYIGLDDASNGFPIDSTLHMLATLDHTLLDVSSHSLKQYFLKKRDKSIGTNIHPLIFALIIVLYGGIHNPEQNSKTNIGFDPRRMHRNSPLSSCLIEYFTKNPTKWHQSEYQSIIKHCQEIIQESNKKDLCLEVVDSFIALLILYGSEFFSSHDVYLSYSAFDVALNRLKRSLIQIQACTFCPEKIKNFGKVLIEDFFEKSGLDSFNPPAIRSDYKQNIMEAFKFINAIAGTLCRLAANGNILRFSLPPSIGKKNFVNGINNLSVNITKGGTTSFLLTEYLRLHNSMITYPSASTDLDGTAAVDMVKFRNKTHPIFVTRDNFEVLLAFIPRHLQNLFLQIILCHRSFQDENIPEIYRKTELHLLTEMIKTMKFPEANGNYQCLLIALFLPKLRQWGIESYALAYIWKHENASKNMNKMRKNFYEFCKKLNEREDRKKVYLSGERNEISAAIQEQRIRAKEAIAELKRGNVSDELNLELYCAAISLGHLSACETEVSSTELFNEAKLAVEAMTDPVLKIRAMSVILQVTDHQVVFEQRIDARKSLEKIVTDMKGKIPVLPYAFVIIDCLPFLQSDTLKDQLITTIFTNMKKLNENDVNNVENTWLAICEAICSLKDSYPSIYIYLRKFCEEHQWSSIDNLIKFLRLSSIPMKKFLSQKYKNDTYDLNRSTLRACALLCGITVDINHLTNWIGSQMLQKLDQIQMSNPDSTFLRITKNLSTFKTNNDKVQKICNELSEYANIAFCSSELVIEWLSYAKYSPLGPLLEHASLLLSASSFFTVPYVDIVCHLLLSDNDRFRQRAELILSRESRKSSQLGWDVLKAFINNCVYYRCQNAYVSVILLWMFEEVEINDRDHLAKILKLELERTRFYLYRQAKGVDALKKNCSFKDFQASGMDVNISIAYLIHNMSVNVMQAFIDYIFAHMSSEMEGSDIELYDQHLSVIIFYIGRNFFDKTNDVDSYACRLLTNYLVDILESEHIVKFQLIQQAVFAVLGYRGSCYFELSTDVTSDPIFTLIVDLYTMDKNSDEKETRVLSLTNIHADYSKEILIKAVACDDSTRKMLEKCETKAISDAALWTLSRSYCGDRRMDDLLEVFGVGDCQLCYDFLMKSSGYIYISEDCAVRIEQITYFILKFQSLLPKFIKDLYESIKHFTDKIAYGDESHHHVHFGEPIFVEVAAELTKHIPTAFCNEVRQNENFKEVDFMKKLYYTSLQHSFPRRAACIEVLSTFGKLTVDLASMFVTALRDNAHLQRTVYRCVSRIQKATRDAIEYLLKTLNSLSMNNRYIAAKLLVVLVHKDVASINEVQDALIQAIENSTSKEELWVIDNLDSPNQFERKYVYLSRLDEALYGLLIQLSFLQANDSIRNIVRKEQNKKYASIFKADFENVNKGAELAAFHIQSE